jgi:hypothetical protein
MRAANPRELQNLEQRERRQLESLVAELGKNRVDAASVSEALPEAVALRSGRDSQLPKSLVDVTEKAIEYSVNRNPAALCEALFPIIGSAIRKALQRLLTESMARMNTGLESAFSFKRLAWRFESWRTKTPYAQIVLRDTVECRVEQVFLIHREKGLLLATVAQDTSQVPAWSGGSSIRKSASCFSTPSIPSTSATPSR